MYNLLLEINRKCNLKCNYCYLGDKDNKEIKDDVFKKVISIFIKETLKQKDKIIYVSFIGGEPLLDFNKIKKFVKFIDRRCKENGLKCIYGITTNATLLDDKITDFLIKKRFELKVSLDGVNSAHDKNRITFDGTGSHKLIIKNLNYILRYEKETGKKCVIANVITTNNVRFLSSSLNYTYSLGFKVLESGINIFENWGVDDTYTLEKELLKSFRIYKSIKNRGDSFTWIYIENKLRSFFSGNCFYRCKAGLNSSFVDLEGNIYTCDSISELKIGDYSNGLDYKKIEKLINKKDKPIKLCSSCKYINNCDVRSCFAKNFRINGDIYDPVKINCIETKILYDIFEYKLEEKQKYIFKNYFCNM